MSRPEPGRLRLPKAPVVLEDELAGGVPVISVRRRGVPLVELRLVFAVDAEHVAKAAGPSVLAESILAGTDRHNREELAEAVERLGGRLGASHYDDRFVLSASVLAPNLREILELLAEVLTGASYPAAEVRADRERLANETLIALSQPEVIADEALGRRLYAGHPYAAGMPRPGTLRRVGGETLRSLHPGLLEPAAARLVLVGDLDPRRVVSMASDVLAPWLATSSGGDRSLPPLPDVRPGPLELVGRTGSVQSNLRLGGRAPTRSDPESPAATIANLIFGGMFASRLVENLRERNGYTYSPRSSIRHGRAGSSLVVTADVGKEVTAASLVEVRYELGRLAVGGVTDAELDSARRYAIGTFVFLTATQSGLADTLAALLLGGVGPGYLATYPKAIAKTAKADVEAAGRRYLAPAELVTVVVGDAEVVARSLSMIDTVTVKST
ncbi:MAG TPA: pitrilysin family protein [Acidimicrobiales bacterium]|nr:pitrilysin family protein [Acidimicrobiales bacterium]